MTKLLSILFFLGGLAVINAESTTGPEPEPVEASCSTDTECLDFYLDGEKNCDGGPEVAK